VTNSHLSRENGFITLSPNQLLIKLVFMIVVV